MTPGERTSHGDSTDTVTSGGARGLVAVHTPAGPIHRCGESDIEWLELVILQETGMPILHIHRYATRPSRAMTPSVSPPEQPNHD